MGLPRQYADGAAECWAEPRCWGGGGLGVGKCRTRWGKCRAGRAAHILGGAAPVTFTTGIRAHLHRAEGVGRRVGVGPAFMSKEVGRSWHLSEGRRLLGAGQMRLLPRLGREVHAVRGHAGRHRSSQWRAPCRPGAQLAAAPRTEGANQGWRMAHGSRAHSRRPLTTTLPPPAKVPRQVCRR